MAGSVIKIKDDTGSFQEVKTNDKGKYRIRLNEKKEYKFQTIYKNYKDGHSNLSTKNHNTLKNLELIIPMNKLKYRLEVLISDKQSGNPLEKSKIIINDKLADNTEFFSGESDIHGIISRRINNKNYGDKLELKANVEKSGYLKTNNNFEITLADDSIIKIAIVLDKLALGVDIGKVVNINPIYFDVDKSNIRSDAALELDKIVKAMNDNPSIVIELGSHTDCRASAKYNLLLSDKRAKSSAAYIISKGISKSRIYVKGYGESKLVNDCACEGAIIPSCSEEEHQMNRRTEFKIVKIKN